VNYSQQIRRRTLRFEALESRHVLTGVTASLTSAGVLNIVGADGVDQILVRQLSDRISLVGIAGSWSIGKVTSIDISVGGDGDFVSLASFANGGNQTLGERVTVRSGTGSTDVQITSSQKVFLNAPGEVLKVVPGNTPTVNGVRIAKVVTSISSSGVLTITGTPLDDKILLKQSIGRISIAGVMGSWTASSVSAIVINLKGGADYVSLDSSGTGGSEALRENIAINSLSGSKVVHLAGGQNVQMSGAGRVLAVLADGTASIDGIIFTPSPGNWWETNIQDQALRALGSQEFADGQLDRNDMITLLRQAEAAGPITSAEITDLDLIANTRALFGGLDYVWQLAGDIILGNSANANYQGTSLGNLTIGSGPAQLESLIDKWFLGMDHPNSGGFSYSLAAGSLFVNGPSYTDVHQGGLGDCTYMATLAEIALRDPSAIKNMFIDNGDGTYTVRFYSSVEVSYVTVDSYLPDNGSGAFVYAHTGGTINDPANELWVALAEKAYCQAKEISIIDGSPNAYSSIVAQHGYMTLANITGQRAAGAAYTSASTSRSTFAAAWKAGESIVLSSFISPPQIVGLHCYAVVGFNATTGSVTVFNPWGIEVGLTTLSWGEVQANFPYFERTV
jgi:hypothetical protein